MLNLAKRIHPGRHWLSGFCLMLLAATPLLMAEVQFESLQVGLETYKNVTVTSKTDKHLFIKHSKGFANIKVADLEPQIQAQLGFNPTQTKLASQNRIALEDLPIDPKILETKQQVLTQFQQQWGGMQQSIILAALALSLAFYFFFCYCAKLICLKAGSKPGPLIWIPILQYLPLFKAAGMSPAWFLGLFLPLLTPLLAAPVLKMLGPENWALLLIPQFVPMVIWLVWCVKISKARGLGFAMAFLLIFPLTSLFAFLYLAFGPTTVATAAGTPSSGAESYKSQATDTAFFYQT